MKFSERIFYGMWGGKQPPPKQQIIDIQGNGTLLCDATGDPAPSFTWFKDGKRITSSTPQVKIENNKLVFKNVRLEEDGMYQCVAESSLGMIVSSTWINGNYCSVTARFILTHSVPVFFAQRQVNRDE
ncbi:hypothetical protein ACROYT_G012162 [Oculina patagonica]